MTERGPTIEYGRPTARWLPWGLTARLASALALYPLAYLVSLYTTWLAARISLGHWPYSSLDDPKSIGPLVDAPYVVTAVLMMCWVLVFAGNVLLSAFAVALAASSPERRLLKTIAWAGVWPAVTWLGTYLIVQLDPAGVIYWFMD